MKAHFRILCALTIVTGLLTSCGPAPNPKLQSKPVGAKEETPAPRAPTPVVEQQPAPLPAEAPQPQVIAKPKRETPAKAAAPVKAAPAKQAPAPRAPAVATASAAPADGKGSADPRTLNLPAPIAPPIPEPLPPADEVKAVP